MDTVSSLQLCGADEVAAGLDGGAPVRLVLVRAGADDADVLAAVARARHAGVPVVTGSAGDLRRMSRTRPAADILALVERRPEADLEALLGGGGAVWLLTGVAYPGNVGYVIRTAEVSGATGVVVNATFGARDRTQARRVAMGADRFLPVCWAATEQVLDGAVAAGRTIVGIEDCGTAAPWEVDLTGDLLLVVGGERDGIPPAVLARCDHVIAVPMAGFVPSYNLQGPVAVVAVERLRQLRG